MNTFYRISLIMVLFFVLLASQLIANNGDNNIGKNLTGLLGSASEGTEFFLTFHPCWEEVTNPNNKILIYVSSSYKTKVNLQIPGKSILKQQECMPNGVIVFELTTAEAQCYEKTSGQEPSAKLDYPGYGIIIRSEKPVVCYGLNTSQTTSEGFLAIPKTALGSHYIVSSYNSATTEETKQYLTSYTSIVGVYSDTKVEICIGGSKNNYTEKPSDFRIGSTKTITLQPGDVYLIGVKGDYNDLTGTTIDATKPVSVISGSFGTYVPKEFGYAGYLIEQDIPISAWGSQYHVMPINGRLKPSIIRIMAAKPNTMVYVNGYEYATIATAGGEEGKGFIELRAQAEGETVLNPITITANNRIAVTQYNTGTEDDAVSSAPFQTALTPVEQYRNEITWTIPNNQGQAMYTKNYVNICYITNDLTKIPDDIMFGQSNGTTIEWKKLADVATRGKVLFDDKLPEGQFWRATTLELYNPAYTYCLKGDNNMSVYCYGIGGGGEYGYSAISGFKDISKADIYKPTLEYSINCTGNITGTITDEPESDASLRTNLKEANLSKDESYNVTGLEITNGELVSGVTYKLNFSLNVIDVDAQAKAVIYASDCAGNDTSFVIEYNPIKFSMDKTLYNFGGNFVDAPPKTITCELTNQSETPVTLDSIYLKSKYKKSNLKFAGFTIGNKIYKENGGKLPELTLNAGEKITFDVTFDPSSVKEDFIGGKSEFIDSIGIIAYNMDNSNECKFTKYLAQVTGYVQFLDTLAPSVIYKPCCCGNTASGTVTDEPANDPANRSNLAYIGLNNSKSFNCSKVKYDETKFVPGTTSSIDWEVSTIDPESDGKAVIIFSDRAGNETEITVDLIKIKVSTQNKIFDFGLKNLNDMPESRTILIKNESSKAIVVDSITILSCDKSRDWPFSGFMIDNSIYESNGGILPGYTLPSGGVFAIDVIFYAKTVKTDIESGKFEFKDSIGIKANWNSELNQYCFNEYKSELKAKIEPVSVDDPNNTFGITDITPNPANTSSVSINYYLEYDCNVELSLFNSSGMLIKELLNTYQTAGNQSFSLPINEFAAGIYFVEFRACGLIGHKSFVIVK